MFLNYVFLTVEIVTKKVILTVISEKMLKEYENVVRLSIQNRFH